MGVLDRGVPTENDKASDYNAGVVRDSPHELYSKM